jgi:hypothetical protein
VRSPESEIWCWLNCSLSSLKTSLTVPYLNLNRMDYNLYILHQ